MITTSMVRQAAWELYAEQYQGGDSISTIAKRVGQNHETVRKRLKAMGVHIEGRKNTSKTGLCPRGHDLAIFGRQLFTKNGAKNGRECTECKRERQRVG